MFFCAEIKSLLCRGFTTAISNNGARFACLRRRSLLRRSYGRIRGSHRPRFRLNTPLVKIRGKASMCFPIRQLQCSLT